MNAKTEQAGTACKQNPGKTITGNYVLNPIQKNSPPEIVGTATDEDLETYRTYKMALFPFNVCKKLFEKKGIVFIEGEA